MNNITNNDVSMVGKRIRERRKELGIGVLELANMIGRDRTTIYRYETGDISNMPIDLLKPLSEALETTPAFLLGWDNMSNSEILSFLKKNSLSKETEQEAIEYIKYLIQKDN